MSIDRNAFLRVLVVCSAVVTTGLVCGATEIPESTFLPDGPDFKDVLGLESARDPRVSPDGRHVLYTVASTEWEDNRYDTEIWLARDGEEPFQVTRTAGGGSSHGRWSPDGKRIAFLADRGNGTQIWLIRALGGEARPLTSIEDGVTSFEWSPEGDRMAVAITDPQDERRKKLEESYGAYAVEDDEFQMTHLWILDVRAALQDHGGAELPAEIEKEGHKETNDESTEATDSADDKPPVLRRLTRGAIFTVDSYQWSPDGAAIAFAHAPDPRVESSSNTDISLIDVVSGEVRPLVQRLGPDSGPMWSPDGGWVLFGTGNGKTTYYLNQELAKVAADGGTPVVLTGDFDEDARPVAWLNDGIRFLAFDRTHIKLFHLDPDTGTAAAVAIDGAPRIMWSAHHSKDGLTLAYQGEGPETLNEIYRLAPDSATPQRLTRMTEQTSDWAVGSREIVQWQSRDGATIEGVLLKPEAFDLDTKHPLLVIIHGGPTWASIPTRTFTYVYPVQQWLAKGAVILMPNYRGSAGYGEAFRSLNVRNLGVGDAWDVMSGVDHLIDLGFVDSDRMGAMGWSQGGYISAFLTTTTDRFRAISVGAGISNWMTYYVNTDIHPFTRHYLKSTPWDDPEVYAKTSPMTYINDAVTPTLIQHGEFDRRVPVPNAYELYQGLQDVGVATELIIYKGFGHGIIKPKERLAAVWHNWRWFASWIWDEDVKIPIGEEGAE